MTTLAQRFSQPWIPLLLAGLGSACSGGSSPAAGEALPECLQYERAVADCYHRDVSIANQPALIPHSDEQRTQIRALCRQNLENIQLACR